MSRAPTARALVAVALLALALPGCGGGDGDDAEGARDKPTTTEAGSGGPLPEGSAWAEVLSGIGEDGTVDPDTAMAAFALAFGPVEGVTVPEGPTGGVLSGSGPLRWAVAVREHLPADQREAVDAVLDEAVVAGGGGPGAARPRADGPGTGDYRLALDEALARYNGPLGPLSIGTSVVFVGVHGNALAYAKAVNAQGDVDGTPAHCVIGVTPSGKQLGTEGIMLTMAHEAFHCYEAVWLGSLDRYYSTEKASPWMMEGGAEWASVNASPDAIPDNLNFWINYLPTPADPLFERSYDAIGFYGQVAQQGVDLWPLFPKFFAASSNVAAYHVLADEAGSAFLDAWAPGFWRAPDRGAAWEITGKAVPAASTVPVTPPAIAIAKGSSEAVSAKPFANTLREIQASSDLIHLAFTGHARFSDANGFDSTGLADLYLCTRSGGECACPDDSGDGSAGLPPSRQSVGGTLMLAVTGGPDGSQGSIEGLSLDDFCKKRTTTTMPGTTNVIRPCELFTAANVARLTGVTPTAPGAEVFGDETTNRSGICEYGPPQLGGAEAVAGLNVLYRPSAALAEGDYAMMYAASCPHPVPGVGTRAGVGTIPGGTVGCLLDGSAIVTVTAGGGDQQAMTDVLRDIANRL